MPDQFGNFDNYEKSYIRSQLRSEQKRIRSLKTKKTNFFIKILNSFKPFFDNCVFPGKKRGLKRKFYYNIFKFK